MGEHFAWRGWGLSVLAMAILVVVAVLPPLVSEPWRIAIMQAFDPLCHQISARSPHWHGVQLAVCHRCFGVYLGLASGPLAMLILGRWNGAGTRLLIALSLVPLSVDWGLDVAGLWNNTPCSRMITGAVFGLMAGILVSRAMALRK